MRGSEQVLSGCMVAHHEFYIVKGSTLKVQPALNSWGSPHSAASHFHLLPPGPTSETLFLLLHSSGRHLSSPRAGRLKDTGVREVGH